MKQVFFSFLIAAFALNFAIAQDKAPATEEATKPLAAKVKAKKEDCKDCKENGKECKDCKEKKEGKECKDCKDKKAKHGHKEAKAEEKK